jgi:DNA-binding IclR family transcriptional regulator
VTRGVGDLAPAWTGASGKAILAHVSEATLKSVLHHLPAGVDEKTLRAELESVRRKGIAVSRGEIYVGAVGMAAPFFDYIGNVAGSMGVFAPEARFGSDSINKARKRVRKGCQQLSAALGDVAAAREAAV